MNSHDLLGIALPTNEPQAAFNLFLPTLKYFKRIAPYSTILFNFQEPWTSNQINDAVKICEDLGFTVKYSYNKYEISGKGLIPFNKIRTDACKNNVNTKFYVLMDDDFSFLDKPEWISADTDYMRALHYLIYHDKCGAILMKAGFLRGICQPRQVYPVLDFKLKCVTERGIIVRKLNNTTIVPDNAVDLLGSDEEKVAVSWRIKEGYYPAVMNNVQLHHYENDVRNSNSETSVQSGEVMYQWNRKDILDNNANKFIREYYPEFENRGALVTTLGDYSTYVNAGGPTEFNKLFEDYNNISLSSIITDIDNYIESN